MPGTSKAFMVLSTRASICGEVRGCANRAVVKRIKRTETNVTLKFFIVLFLR
jgi:hypothetical protein